MSFPENFKQRLKESYDAIAPVYNDWTRQHLSYRLTYLGKLLERLPSAEQSHASGTPLSFLELGCGAGLPVTEELLKYGPESVTIKANDISSTQIALGKERLGTEGVEWIEGDMMQLEFADGSFDAVIGLYSLIHLPRTEQDVLLQRIVRWLKPGGYILLNFASEELESEIMEKWLAEEGWMCWSAWGAEKTLGKVKEAGLEVIVADIVKDEVDASFIWIIAKAPSS